MLTNKSYIGNDPVPTAIGAVSYYPSLDIRKSYHNIFKTRVLEERYMYSTTETYEQLKALGVEIREFTCTDADPRPCMFEKEFKSWRNFVIGFGIPERYDYAFFKGLTDKLVFNYIKQCVVYKLPPTFHVGVYYTNEIYTNMSQVWSESDYMDVRHMVIRDGIESLENNAAEHNFHKFLLVHRL